MNIYKLILNLHNSCREIVYKKKNRKKFSFVIQFMNISIYIIELS